MDKAHRDSGYFDPRFWQHQLNPSPEKMARAMLGLKDLVRHFYVDPKLWYTIVGSPPRHVTRDAYVEALIANLPVAPADWTVDDDDLFWSYVDPGFDAAGTRDAFVIRSVGGVEEPFLPNQDESPIVIGWDIDTWCAAVFSIRAALLWGKLHGDEVKFMPDELASRILAQAEEVLEKAEQTQTDINVAVQFAFDQKKRGAKAGKSRIKFTDDQKPAVADEVDQLVKDKVSKSAAFDRIGKKYQVSGRTIQRCYDDVRNGQLSNCPKIPGTII